MQYRLHNGILQQKNINLYIFNMYKKDKKIMRINDKKVNNI